MQTWRNDNAPPSPHTLINLNDLLQMDQWKSMLNYSRGKMTVTTVKSGDTVSLLMFNPEYAKLFSSTEELFFDATFQITPRMDDIYQVFVIMLDKFNHVRIII